jgi:hypothetical protein
MWAKAVCMLWPIIDGDMNSYMLGVAVSHYRSSPAMSLLPVSRIRIGGVLAEGVI